MNHQHRCPECGRKIKRPKKKSTDNVVYREYEDHTSEEVEHIDPALVQAVVSKVIEKIQPLLYKLQEIGEQQEQLGGGGKQQAQNIMRSHQRQLKNLQEAAQERIKLQEKNLALKRSKIQGRFPAVKR